MKVLVIKGFRHAIDGGARVLVFNPSEEPQDVPDELLEYAATNRCIAEVKDAASIKRSRGRGR